MAMTLQHEQDAVLQWLNEHHKEVTLDPLSVPRDKVSHLVNEAVLTRSLGAAENQRLVKRVMDHLVGAGMLTPFFDDPTITEIMVTGDRIYVEKHGHKLLAARLPSKQVAIDMATHICDHCHDQYQTSKPLMNLTWPENGARINIVHHEVSPTGAAITIRLRNQERPLHLEDLLQSRMVSEEAALLLVEGARGLLNILFSGPMGSGKTTVLRAIAVQAIGRDERVIVLEDTEELRLPLEHMLVHIGRTDDPTESERIAGIITIQDLFRNTLRQRPDRIVVGEIRGLEAFDLIQATISAEGGMFSTIHLRRPDALLERLLWIAQRNRFNVDVGVLERTLPKAIDLVVQVDQDATGHRHVSRIVESLPDGRWEDLFVWDHVNRVLRTTGHLTRDHTEWLAIHQTQRQQTIRETESVGFDVWQDILIRP